VNPVFVSFLGVVISVGLLIFLFLLCMDVKTVRGYLPKTLRTLLVISGVLTGLQIICFLIVVFL
jgi:hypothetical protein